MTGALLAKRGERDISRGARHERNIAFAPRYFARSATRAQYRVRPAWLIIKAPVMQAKQ